MKTYISIALIGSAALLLVISLLEVFLNDTQKAQIDNFTLRLWNVLDELKARRLLDWLQPRQCWFVGAGVLFAAAFVLWVEIKNQRTWPLGIRDIIIACIVFGPGIWFGLKK
jgi:hypothetical protein